MTNQDLDQYSALLSALFNLLGARRRFYARLYGSNNAMLKADARHPPSEAIWPGQAGAAT
jgi:hypothetical protein